MVVTRSVLLVDLPFTKPSNVFHQFPLDLVGRPVRIQLQLGNGQVVVQYGPMVSSVHRVDLQLGQKGPQGSHNTLRPLSVRVSGSLVPHAQS